MNQSASWKDGARKRRAGDGHGHSVEAQDFSLPYDIRTSSFAEGISSTHICGASPSHYEFSRGGNGGSRMGGGSLGFGSFGFGSPIGGGPPGGGSFLLSKHRLSLGDLSPEMIDAIATLEHFNASGSDSVGVS